MTSVFISHTNADKEEARRLFAELGRIGVRAWLDEREIRVGDDIPQGIERGIAESDYIAVILTPRSIRSRWVREELSSVQMDGVESGNRKILPLLFETCELPPLLRSKRFADFRRDFREGFRELLEAIGIDEPATPEIDHCSGRDSATYDLEALSLVWDSRGKYRGLRVGAKIRSQF